MADIYREKIVEQLYCELTKKEKAVKTSYTR